MLNYKKSYSFLADYKSSSPNKRHPLEFTVEFKTRKEDISWDSSKLVFQYTSPNTGSGLRLYLIIKTKFLIAKKSKSFEV